tara:strand:- start:62 stop:640 length:579 start_codon:yes stop_codon:yes gene_type:complete
MSDIQIIDDYLPEKEYRSLYQYFIDSEFGYEGQSCPWYWVDGTSYFDDGYYMFVNLCYGNYTIVNNTMFNLLLPFTARLKVQAYFRIKANLTLPTQTQQMDVSSQFHVDNPDCNVEGDSPMMTAIFYMNTNNGATVFEDGTIVESVANRLTIFPCHKKHAARPHTEGSKNRIVINFNYYKGCESLLKYDGND